MNARNYAAITTEDSLKALVDKLMTDELPIGFDIEAGYSGADREKGSLNIDWDMQAPCGFSITNSKNWARYVPTGHTFSFGMERGWELIKPVLETLPVIAHNMKYEKRNLRVLDRKGIGPNIEINAYGDSMLQSYALAMYPRHGLKSVVFETFGHRMAEIESLFPDLPKNKMDALRFNILDVNNPLVVDYACEDALWCLAAFEHFSELIEQNPKAAFIYQLEMQTMELLCDMEDAGHATDWESLNYEHSLAGPFEAQMVHAARQGLGEMSGMDLSTLNLKSPKQMKQVLYTDLGLSTTRKTKTGEPSTDAIALESLSREHPAIKKVLEVREVGNLAGRLKKWSTDYSIAHDKRVHPNFNQVVVGSGRFSANDPSIQQLPKEWRWTTLLHKELKIWDDDNGHWEGILESETTVPGKHYWGGNFRDFLIAAPATYLLFFDYSQVELRALAGMSQEPYLIDAFNRGIDIHTATAAMMLGKAIEDITSKDRGKGKAQPLDATVWTPDGPVRMGDITEGRTVLTPDGRTAKVSGVFPQGLRPTYRVTFNDGSETECDEEHLWTVKHSRRGFTKTLTTREILDSGIRIGGADLKWSIPTIQPQKFREEQSLPVDPYALGLLLGDGSLKGPGVYFASEDPELVEGLRRSLPDNVEVSHTDRCNYRVSTPGAVGKHSSSNKTIQSLLREAGVFGQGSHDKRVPDAYKYGSPETRHAVIQGLVDTDGYVTPSGSVSFTLVSEAMVGDVREMVLSLGGTCGLVARKETSWVHGEEKRHGEAYRITFNLPQCPARLPRKAEKWKPSKAVRRIKSIEYVGEIESQCIMVDHPDHLYLTDDFIVTHNTINFGIVYGMGAKLLAEQLAISVEEAQELLDRYMGAFSRVSQWMSMQKALGVEYGFVETHFGRKVTLWDLQSDNFAIRGKGERLCVNAPVQGTAADIMKISMLRAKKALVERGWWMSKVRMINNVHDALTFEADNDIDPTELRALLTPCVSWEIPGFPEIVADWDLGQSWGSAEKWEDYHTTEYVDGVWQLVGEKPASAPAPVDTTDKHPENVENWESDHPAEDFTIELEEMPSATPLRALANLLKENPGNSLVTLVTPQGVVELVNMKTCLSVSANKAEIIACVGSAKVYVPRDLDLETLNLELEI